MDTSLDSKLQLILDAVTTLAKSDCTQKEKDQIVVDMSALKIEFTRIATSDAVNINIANADK